MPGAKEAAHGKWHGLLQRFGIDARLLDGKHHPCPVTGEGEDRFRFSNRNGNGSFFCSCSRGEKDGFDLLKCKMGWDYKTAATEVEKIVGDVSTAAPKRERAPEEIIRDLREMRDSLTDAGDIVRAYLSGRGISSVPATLRQGLSNYKIGRGPGGKLPCMVAEVRTPHSRVISYHITYLDRDGKKAALDKVKFVMKQYPNEEWKGCAIQLMDIGEDGTLGVAEGIETALSCFQMYGVPTWSTVSAYGMETFDIPHKLRNRIKRVVVFGDNDQKFAGQRAAYMLAHRVATGRNPLPVEVHIPSNDKVNDYNDLLMGARRGD